MRIAYVGAVPPLKGGIAQHGGQLVRALRDVGHDVLVESWRHQYPTLLYPGNTQVDPDASPVQEARYRMEWWNPVSWYRTGVAVRDADLLVFPWVTPLQAPAIRVVAAAARHVPIVFVVHNPRPHERQPFVGLLTSWAFRVATGAIAQHRKAVLTLSHLAPQLRWQVVDHPPNLSVVQRDPPSPPPWRLLFFGFVRPYKGVASLIRSLGPLHRSGLDVRLTVAGQFWGGMERWQRFVHENGLTDVVDLHPGYVPDHEVSALLGIHHIVMVPYLSATQSGIVPLAYAAGRPVVATRVGGLVDQVVDGETGALARAGDPESIARCVQRVIGDYPAMQRSAGSHVADWRELARAVVEIGATEARSHGGGRS